MANKIEEFNEATNQFKLVNFNYSYKVSTEMMMNWQDINFYGNKGFIAPECFDNLEKMQNHKYDVFSIGIIFYRLYFFDK